MTVKPFYMTGGSGSNSGSGNGTDNSAEVMNAMPVNQVFVKNSLGKLVGIGIRQLADGTVLAPNNFGVESGSINFGDLITVSEASGYLGIWNHLDDKHYQIVDYHVPRDKASSKPYYFRLKEGEFRFDGASDDSYTITKSPLTFTYTTQLNARTNSIILTAASEMKNVRIRISKGEVTLKYLPTKAAYLGQETGYDFQKGENIIDFGDSPVPLSSGVTLHYEILADNMALKGSSDNLPKLSSYVQRGEYVNLISSEDVSQVAVTGDYNDLVNKPAPEEIDYPVSSVNGKTGDVELTAEDVSAAPTEHTHEITDVKYLADVLNSKMNSNATIPYSQLSGTPEIPPAQVQSDWSSTDQTSVSFIKNKPYIFDGNYEHLSNRPTIFSGNYSDLVGAPALSTVAETGSYVDLKDKPTLFDGDYNSLANKPSIPKAQVNADWAATSGVAQILNKPALFSGDYADLTNKPTIPAAQVPSDWNATTGVSRILNKPTLFSGAYADLTGKPSLFSGSYTDLTNKPVLFDGTWASLSGKPSFSTVATSGSYVDLVNKPTIPAAQIQSDWNQTNNTALDFIKNKPTIPTVSYPVNSVNNKTGTVNLAYSDVGAAPALHAHPISDITGLQTALDSKLATGASIPYTSLTGTPTIPTKTSQLTNDSGFLTTSAVTSVNGKTGAVTLSPTDFNAAPAAQGTKFYRSTGAQVGGVKVKYYTVTADSNGAWTLSLGTDFTEIFDVQVTALSTNSTVSGIRQATLNTYVPTSTTLSGAVFTNSVLVTLLVSGTNSLTMAPSATVKIRVEGLGS